MSQFIVLGKNNLNYNLSNISISLPDNYILFTKDNQIAGLPYPTYKNNILQWDPDSQVYFWNTLSLSTITGNKETSKGILWNDLRCGGTVVTLNQVSKMEDLFAVFRNGYGYFITIFQN